MAWVCFLAISCLPILAEGHVATAIEPFLDSSQGIYIENNGYLTADEGSLGPIHSQPEKDVKTSRFYPYTMDTEVYGTVNYFKCGGGTVDSFLQIDLTNGEIFCRQYPTGKDMFQAEYFFYTFDADNGTILIQPVKMPYSYFLKMESNTVKLSNKIIVPDDSCRFSLVYPPKKPPMFRIMRVKADTSNINLDDYKYSVLQSGVVISNGFPFAQPFTYETSCGERFVEVTSWSQKFSKDLNVNAKVLIESKFDYSKSFNITSNFTQGPTSKRVHERKFKNSTSFSLPANSVAIIDFGYYVNENVTVPFTATVKKVEFDTVTSRPVYRIFNVNGTWQGSLVRGTKLSYKINLPTPGPKEDQLKQNFMVTNQLPSAIDGRV